ncbi:MAG: hypothetical protein EB140_06540 [Proteobacteria bacterium]|nr:hypothetical protein [Pseudomonadota bacterium]
MIMPLTNQHNSITWTGNRPLDKDEIPVKVRTNNNKVARMASYPSTFAVFTWVIQHGPASMTVTGITFPASSNTWVIPTLRPINPVLIGIRSCNLHVAFKSAANATRL